MDVKNPDWQAIVEYLISQQFLVNEKLIDRTGTEELEVKSAKKVVDKLIPLFLRDISIFQEEGPEYYIRAVCRRLGLPSKKALDLFEKRTVSMPDLPEKNKDSIFWMFAVSSIIALIRDIAKRTTIQVLARSLSGRMSKSSFNKSLNYLYQVADGKFYLLINLYLLGQFNRYSKIDLPELTNQRKMIRKVVERRFLDLKNNR